MTKTWCYGTEGSLLATVSVPEKSLLPFQEAWVDNRDKCSGVGGSQLQLVIALGSLC